MSFDGKVVLITGAASGIGAGAARHLAKLGASLSIVDVNEKLLNDVADEITAAGCPKPLPIVADITKDTEHIIEETIKHFGRLDVLVNNAGIVRKDSVIDFDVDQYDQVMNTNLKSMIVLTHLAVPHLEKTKGNVINISSVAGQMSCRGYLSYSMSKAGVIQFNKCAAAALASKGIRVNAICPGVIRTPIYNVLGVDESNADEFFEAAKSKQLVVQTGDPRDIASAIVYLASEPFINGSILTVDGGYLCV